MRIHNQNRSVAGSLTIYPSNRLRSVKSEPRAHAHESRGSGGATGMRQDAATGSPVRLALSTIA
jgi:hypothetical protein